MLSGSELSGTRATKVEWMNIEESVPLILRCKFQGSKIRQDSIFVVGF